MIRRDLSDKSKKRKSSVKKNMNAYMFYAQDARDEVMADVRKEIEEGSLEKNEILGTVGKRTGVKWKSMSAEEKEKYEDMAAKDKERYIGQRIHKQFSICFVMSICVTVIDMQKKKKLKRRTENRKKRKSKKKTWMKMMNRKFNRLRQLCTRLRISSIQYNIKK